MNEHAGADHRFVERDAPADEQVLRLAVSGLPGDAAQLRAELLAHRQRDTLAMVEVHRTLTRLASQSMAETRQNPRWSARSRSSGRTENPPYSESFDCASPCQFVQDYRASRGDIQRVGHPQHGYCDRLVGAGEHVA
jgi:hypothetical protein